jgi:hypothetical protein
MEPTFFDGLTIVVPTGSTPEDGVTPVTAAKIEAICKQCEQQANFTIPTDMYQRITRLVGAYRLSIGQKSVSSYENVIRTAILIVVRAAGFSIPANKIVPRFDGRKAPVFKLMSELNSLLGLTMTTPSAELLCRHCSDIILADMTERGIFSSTQDTPGSEKVSQAYALMRLMADEGFFGSAPLLTQAVACTYFVIRHGCEYKQPSEKKRILTLSRCIKILELQDSEKSIFRYYELLSAFLKKGLLDIGIREWDERTAFENLPKIQHNIAGKAQLAKRIKLIEDS